VVEAGRSARTLSFLGADATLAMWTVMAGPRLSAKLRRVHEYGQVLVGRASSSGSAFSLGGARAAGPDSVSPHLVVQPGIGLDVPLGRRVSARIQLDARMLGEAGNGNENGVQFRMAAGVAYALRP
jgi:hypothetical protein